MRPKPDASRAGTGGWSSQWGRNIAARGRQMLQAPGSSALEALGQLMGYEGADDLSRAMEQVRTTGKMGLPAGLPAGMGAIGAITPISGKYPNLLDDLIARDPLEVQRELGLYSIPEHVLPYGDMMNKMAAKGTITDEDMLRAYNITQSSVQRGARSISPEGEVLTAVGRGDNRRLVPTGKGVPDWMMEAVENGELRPEDAFAQWLRTPAGQGYIEAAKAGQVDEQAMRQIYGIFNDVGYGNQNRLMEGMRWAPSNIPGRGNQQHDLIQMARELGMDDTDPWFRALSDYYLIGPTKAGFYGSMLGYGKSAVPDARQLELHYGGKEGAKRAKSFMGLKGGEGGTQLTNRLTEAQRAMNVQMPEHQLPNLQSLIHHAGWDAMAGSRTTHDPIIQVMLGNLLKAPQ